MNISVKAYMYDFVQMNKYPFEIIANNRNSKSLKWLIIAGESIKNKTNFPHKMIFIACIFSLTGRRILRIISLKMYI